MRIEPTRLLARTAATLSLTLALATLVPGPAHACDEGPGALRSATRDRPVDAQSPAVGPPADSLRNGTLIGAGIGFAAGFLAHAAWNAHETASGPVWDRDAVGYYAGSGLIGAGIGAGIGALVDGLRKGRGARGALRGPRLAVAPVHSRRASALFLSLRY